MENVQTKVPKNRRGKFLVITLVVIILVLLFHIYRERNFKKNLVRRKAFLIAMLRESKVSKGRMSLKIATQGKDLAAKQKEIQVVQMNLDETTKSYQQQAELLKGLQESATERKNSLDALQKQYDDASTTINTVKDKLERTIESCQDSTSKNEGLNKDIKAKEFALEECLQEKETLSKEKQDIENNYKRQMALLQQTQSTGNARLQSNVNPPRETTYNQQPPLGPSPAYTGQSNAGSFVTQTRNDYPKQAQVPVESQITTRIHGNKAIEPGTSSQMSKSNPDSSTTSIHVNKATEPGTSSQTSNSNPDSSTIRENSPLN